jgi:hypothetical protein
MILVEIKNGSKPGLIRGYPDQKIVGMPNNG